MRPESSSQLRWLAAAWSRLRARSYSPGGGIAVERDGIVWDGRAVLVGLMVPTVAIILNQSMFGVALPQIRDQFNAQADLMAWVVTAYTLPYVVLMPLYGRLGDALGRKRFFMAGLIIFGIGTALNLLADRLSLLMVGRAIQGMGAAGVMPLAMAMVSDLFPASQRGRALGTWNSVGPATGMVGPMLSGFLVDHWGWGTIYVPVTIACLLAAWASYKAVPPVQAKQDPLALHGFDWLGALLMGGAISGLLFYVSSDTITGVPPLRDFRLLGADALLFAAFVLWERQRQQPFISLDIFRQATFSLASLCAGTRMFTMSGVGFLLPLFLADVWHLSGVVTGTVLTIHAASLLVTVRIGGAWADRLGSRVPVILGLTGQAIAMALLALLPAQAPLVSVYAIVVGHGLLAGLSLAALHRAAMGGVAPDEMGIAAGVYSTIRFGGSVLGTALGGVLLQRGLDLGLAPAAAYHAVFWMIAAVAASGALLGSRLRD
ncbi:MAG: DHA2 family efflux MFS transporter permease subunit [Anaerolineae bacterium]